MRSITIILTMLLMLSGLSWFSFSYLHTTAQNLNENLQTVEQFLRQGEYALARQELETTQDTWKSRKNILTILIDHQEINTIELTMSRVDILLENQSPILSLTELISLRKYIENVTEQEKFTLSNIF